MFLDFDRIKAAFQSPFLLLERSGMMIFATIIISLFMFSVNYYIFSRLLKALEYFYKKLPIWINVSISFISTTIITLGFFRSMFFENAVVKSVLKTLFSYWLGVFMYLFIFVVIADIVNLCMLAFKKTESKRAFIRAVSMICALVLALSVSVYGFYHATVIKHKAFDVNIGLKDDMKIVLISDLHLGAVKSEDRLTELVERINEQDADVVCICGDVFDNDYNAVNNPKEASDTLKRIKSKYGVYAVLGNHDSGDGINKMKSFIDDCGFILLEENYAIVNDSIILVGRSDPSPIGGTSDRTDTKDLFETIPDNKPIVVMDHNPHFVDEYKDKADMVLSGHTHKGQCFPGSIITNLMYEVDYGYAVTDSGVNAVVTSGFGTWGMPMRVGTDSEIVTINLN